MSHLTENIAIGSAWTKKALAAGALVAALLMGVLMAAPLAHASTSTFLVNSTDDQPDAGTTDGKCVALNGSCTLRAAIQQANATPGADVIKFTISGGEVHTITPSSPLPRITEAVTIDGYSQPGASENTLTKGTNAQLKIELNGTNAGSGANGLEIGAKKTVVKGLVINGFQGDGIDLLGGDEGGGPTSNGSKIKGNFIGTDPAGTVALGNHNVGLQMTGTSNVTVGGTTASARNLISGNELTGVTLSGLGVGGSNKVEGNLIGTDKTGTGNLGNGDSGVAIILGANNSVGGNTIAFNGRDGVAFIGDDTSTGNRIVSNSIFSNKGLGVDLIDLRNPTEDATTDVRNANDPGDKDQGPNRLQNSPVISSAKTISGKTTIQGKLNSTPNKTYTIQFFSNPKGNEGKRFIGQKAVTTNGSGKVSFSFSPKKALAVGQTITATATKNSTLDTSEFSAVRKVASS